jgi:hypothetical protein
MEERACYKDYRSATGTDMKMKHYRNEVWKHKKKCLPRESYYHHYGRNTTTFTTTNVERTTILNGILIQCPFAKELQKAVATASRGT